MAYSGHVVIDGSGRPLGRTEIEAEPPGVYKPSAISLEGVSNELHRRGHGLGAEDGVRSRRSGVPRGSPLRLRTCGCASRRSSTSASSRPGTRTTAYTRTRCLSRSNGLGRHALSVLDSLEDVPLSRSLRRLMYAEAHARCALDAGERCDRRSSLQHLRQAVRSDPLSVVRPIQAARILAAVGVLFGGERVRGAVAVRRERYWRNAGIHGLLGVSEDTSY